MDDLKALFASLSASFDAQVDHEEERAADDFAFSLRQDGTLAQVLPRLGPCALVTSDGRRLSVATVAPDHVAVGTPAHLVAPLDRAPLVSDPGGPAPARSGTPLVSALREWARRVAEVEVDAAAGARLRGRLVAARRDHLYLENDTGWAVVPLARLITVSLRRPGG